MRPFNEKELEITDYIVEQINHEIFCKEQGEVDKSKLAFSLCLNDAERLQVANERIAKYKSKIDAFDPDLAGYMTELVKHNPKAIDDGDFRDLITKNFVLSEYQELIKELALSELNKIEDYVLSSIVKSRGYSYKKIKNYIDAVCSLNNYTTYKYILDDILEKEKELNKSDKNNDTDLPEKIEIVYLDDIYLKNKDILPESIIKAYNQLGTFKSLYITELKDKTIKNIYQDDLDPFKNIEDKILLEYYCIESNYLNFLSRLNDGWLVFSGIHSLDSLFFEYAKAFITAYSEFETLLNTNQSLIEDTRKQRALKIFSYLLNAEYKNGYFGDVFDNNEEFKNRKGRIISNIELYEWGYNGGQFYKAWEIILNNPLIFEPLFIKYYTDSKINNTNVVVDNKTDDYLKSTIEDYLEEFKEYIKGNGYEVLVNALYDYFTKGSFPILTSKINFKTINKKRVGWELKELYKSEKTDIIDVNYILFAKENINLFENEIYEEHKFRASKLYKAFTTNPAK